MRDEILNRLNDEQWTPLMVFALGCADLEELEKFKNEISLLKDEDRIALQFTTPDEVLTYVKNYYSNKSGVVDKEWQDKWLKWANEQAQDLKNFFNNHARLIKK